MTKGRDLDEVHPRGVNVNKRLYGRYVKFYHSFLQHTEYTFFFLYILINFTITIKYIYWGFFQESLTGHYLASSGSATTFYQALFHLCVRQYMQSYSHSMSSYQTQKKSGNKWQLVSPHSGSSHCV